jgi:hypothetical protein
MNWDNYGKYNGKINHGWNIDHIVPVSSANTEDEVLKLTILVIYNLYVAK